MVMRVYHRTRADGVKLYRTYSSAGKRLLQNETGEVYDEAIDVENAPYTYAEIDETDDPELSAEEALEIIVNGGAA